MLAKVEEAEPIYREAVQHAEDIEMLEAEAGKKQREIRQSFS